MEARKITIVSSDTNNTAELTTNATTLGELKAAMRNAGIQFNETDEFREGITKSYLKDDSALLPENVRFKGQTTNNLIFYLMRPNKKISSGLDRKALVAQLTPSLKEAIKAKYGKNWTICTTEEIAAVVNNHVTTTTVTTNTVTTEAPKTTCCSNTEVKINEINSKIDVICRYIVAIADEMGIDLGDNSCSAKESVSEVIFTPEDIAAMK